MDGMDLNPIFEGKTLKDRDLFFHFPIYLQAYSELKDNGRDPLFRTRPGCVIISGDWKFHQYFEDESFELYNLKSDVGEKHNLAEENPEKTQKLYKKLKGWRAETRAPVPTLKNLQYDSVYLKLAFTTKVINLSI